MKTKFIEIRDRMTRIDAVAIKVEPENDIEAYHIKKAGYGPGNVILMKLDPCEAYYDPYKWYNRRTMTNAHLYIREHFDELESGDVVDVEFILGETKSPKEPSRLV